MFWKVVLALLYVIEWCDKQKLTQVLLLVEINDAHFLCLASYIGRSLGHMCMRTQRVKK